MSDIDTKEQENINNENKDKRRKNIMTNTKDVTNVRKKVIIICALIVLVLVIAFTSIAIANRLNNNMFNNIYFGDINISGKTINEIEIIL